MNVRGAFLLEALVATLVLAIATLGLLGLTTLAIDSVAHARWRAEAAVLASSTVAQMSVAPPSTLEADYDPAGGGAGYRALASLAQHLPGVAAGTNAPSIAIARRAGGSAVTASVRISWQQPGDTAPHRYAIEDALVAW
ncbi:MAG: hypothetical protein JSS46_00185 [Proteobacteria bacterium]|nr:hypothetical protein [Pseudomonadota bacterium]